MTGTFYRFTNIQICTTKKFESIPFLCESVVPGYVSVYALIVIF